MLTKNHIDYMDWLPASRLIEFVNKRSVKELNRLLKNIGKYLDWNLTTEKENKTLQDLLIFIKARLNGLVEERR